MSSSEKDQELINEKTRAEINKIHLEVKSLKKQISWRGQLLQYVAVITVLVTLFGAWQGYLKFREDHQKDQELKSKENDLKDSEQRQKADDEYQLNIQQIASYPGETKETIPSIVLKFQDLKRLIEGGKLSGQAEVARHDVGFLVSYIIQQTDFDLKVPRNVEFDTESLRYCEYYSNYLRLNTDANTRILSKYQTSLKFEHDKNPNVFKAIKRESNSSYSVEGLTAQQEIYAYHVADMLDAYKSHLDLLKQSLKDNPQNTEGIKDMLNQALCDFYTSVNNSSIAQDFFGIDEKALQEQIKQCHMSAR